MRKPATKKEYENMLAFVQTEIAKLTKRKHPQEALERLTSARIIFEKYKNTRHLSYIDMLISETKLLIKSVS